ncbi:zinc metalloproteinase-disintegrin-like BjussuMP-1 [Nematolebias whitei]|uniref:zinc metalloproteinase-disintegrin-like BjussuMP-1 n=1 Tax=Nematolebias whitei TaxID=451745 RepID=UPI001899478B|nr:zinc metalloproteinase-disintegrin-like BjussuMP-1 [Nematolebias whitei]
MWSLWLIWVCLEHSSGLLSHVQNYEVVRPQRRQDRRTRSLRVNQVRTPYLNCFISLQIYPDRVQYDLTIEGRNHTIHLEKNWNLLSENYTETFYSGDGERVTVSPTEEFCFYHGHVQNQADSSVSVGICSGISGFLRVGPQLYLIQPLGRTDREEHAVYKQEQLKVGGYGSASSSATTPCDQDRMPQPAALLKSRSWNSERLAGPQRFVELFVVADNTEYQRYGKETSSRVLGAVNHVDKLYRSLNIRIVLVGLEVWSYRDHISVDPKPETTLDNFLAWRRSDLLQKTKHDNAQFVTGRIFDNDTVGLANKFAMCTENSGGVNQDHQENPLGLASTIAHEMGHNFGLSHDAAGCVCGPTSSSNCVMTERLRLGGQVFPEFFSGCSVRQLSEFMERAQPGCLHRPVSVRTVAVGPLCGNALLDPGEECDCGTEEECASPCCDAATCRLTEGAQCAEGQCCESCQIRASGSVCRKSSGVCDLPEHCTGESPECPEDSFQMNGLPCSNQAPGFCYDGRCPTREQHCWRLFGDGAAVGPDLCFNLNKRGEEGANCGRDQSGFVPCAAADVKCGSTFCVGGGESITGKRAGYTVFGLECKLTVENDRTRSIDMVPNGTKCGPSNVCLGSRCVDVSVYGNKEDCAKKCSNNGVCDHRNRCHCDPGWAPPNCSTKYTGVPPPGPNVTAAAACAASSCLLVVVMVTAGLMRCRRSSSTRRRKVKSAPRKLNPVFRDRPEISRPTLLESTASQACSLLVVAPQVDPARPSPNSLNHQAPGPLQPPQAPAAGPSAPETQQIQGVKAGPPPVPRTKPTPPPPRRPARPGLHRPT